MNAGYQQYDIRVDTSPKEKGYKLDEKNRPGLNEKPTKLLNKKMRYLVSILLVLGSPLSIEELMDLFEYKDKGKFRDNYIKPLESEGFISKTNPDKPTASNQKYVITEKGKRFLTRQDF
jgi:DNA-binding PadR family transcriptional regulator